MSERCEQETRERRHIDRQLMIDNRSSATEAGQVRGQLAFESAFTPAFRHTKVRQAGSHRLRRHVPQWRARDGIFIWRTVGDLLYLAPDRTGICMSEPSFRRDWLSKPIFAWARHVLPSLSETEREAIEAGDVWWDADLFSGNPDWAKLLADAQRSPSPDSPSRRRA